MIDRHAAHAAVAMAEVNIVASSAMTLATLATGPPWSSRLTWRTALILPVAAMVGVQLVARRAPFTARRRPAGTRSGGLVVNRALWLLSAAVLCQTGFEWTVGFWGAEYPAESTSLGVEGAASAMALFFVGILVGRLIGRWVAHRLAPMVVLLSSFGIPLAALPVLALAPSLALQLVGLTLCGVGIGNAYPMIVAEAGRAARGAIDGVLGRLTAIASSSIAATPFVIGSLGDVVGIGRAFWILPAVLALGTLTSVALMRGRSGGAVSP